MEYEGKNKIFYIGTVVLAVVCVLLYATYFIFHQTVDSNRSTREVTNVVLTKEKENVINNGEEIAKEISEELEVQQTNTKVRGIRK